MNAARNAKESPEEIMKMICRKLASGTDAERSPFEMKNEDEDLDAHGASNAHFRFLRIADKESEACTALFAFVD